MKLLENERKTLGSSSIIDPFGRTEFWHETQLYPSIDHTEYLLRTSDDLAQAQLYDPFHANINVGS